MDRLHITLSNLKLAFGSWACRCHALASEVLYWVSVLPLKLKPGPLELALLDHDSIILRAFLFITWDWNVSRVLWGCKVVTINLDHVVIFLPLSVFIPYSLLSKISTLMRYVEVKHLRGLSVVLLLWLLVFLALKFHLFFNFTKSKHLSFGRFTRNTTPLVDLAVWQNLKTELFNSRIYLLLLVELIINSHQNFAHIRFLGNHIVVLSVSIFTLSIGRLVSAFAPSEVPIRHNLLILVIWR